MKHSKKELKHQCDNCCCVDCHQTKKEKLECRRLRGLDFDNITEIGHTRIIVVDGGVDLAHDDALDAIFYSFQRYKEKINEESKN